MTDYLAEARDHAEHAERTTFGSMAYLAHLTAATAFATLAVAEARTLRDVPLAHHVTFESNTGGTNVMSGDDGTGWPERKGYSTSGNTWLCPEPDCGFGVSGLAGVDTDDDDPVGDHMAEHIHFRLATALPQGTEDAAGETTGDADSAPSPAEPSLVALDAADEVLAAARHVKALFVESAMRQSGDWWHAVGTLCRAVDAMELAR